MKHSQHCYQIIQEKLFEIHVSGYLKSLAMNLLFRALYIKLLCFHIFAIITKFAYKYAIIH